MIFGLSSVLNEIVERRLFLFLKESVRSLLALSTSVHCLAKKLLRIKSVEYKVFFNLKMRYFFI